MIIKLLKLKKGKSIIVYATPFRYFWLLVGIAILFYILGKYFPYLFWK